MMFSRRERFGAVGSPVPACDSREGVRARRGDGDRCITMGGDERADGLRNGPVAVVRGAGWAAGRRDLRRREMNKNTKWEAVIGEHGQPSPMYRGLVCLVSCSPSISVVTADRSTVQADEWEDVARLIASAPDLAARAESAEAALAAAREDNERLRNAVNMAESVLAEECNDFCESEEDRNNGCIFDTGEACRMGAALRALRGAALAAADGGEK